MVNGQKKKKVRIKDFILSVSFVAFAVLLIFAVIHLNGKEYEKEHDKSMRTLASKCTMQTEATVLRYEDVPDPFDEGIYIHNPRTYVEADLGSGLQEVELHGKHGRRVGDTLILHYDPDNTERCYTEYFLTEEDKKADKIANKAFVTSMIFFLLLIVIMSIVLVKEEVLPVENKE